MTGGTAIALMAAFTAAVLILATIRYWLPLLWLVFVIWLPLHFMCGVL